MYPNELPVTRIRSKSGSRKRNRSKKKIKKRRMENNEYYSQFTPNNK